MKVFCLCLTPMLLALIPQVTLSQEMENEKANEDWLCEFIDEYEQHREPLEQMDPRCRKLFGDRAFFADIDEKERFVRASDYSATVEAASRWVKQQFPVLRNAFVAEQVETTINLTLGVVFIRGRSKDFDFVAAVQIGDVTCCAPEGPFSITLVLRPDANNELDFDEIPQLQGKGEKDQIHMLTDFLSKFGRIAVGKIREVQNKDETARIEADGSFDGLKISGRLRMFAAPRVVHLELSEYRATERQSGKPFAIEFRVAPERQPDWKGERNVIEQTPPRSEQRSGR